MSEQKKAIEVLERRRQHSAMTRRGKFVKSSAKRSVSAKEFFAEWLEKFGIIKRQRKTANAISAHLRPWIPKNRKLIALHDIRQMLARTEYIAELKSCCTSSQWDHLCKAYPALSEAVVRHD